MPILKNMKHERWIQGMAKGLGGGHAWTAAGYKATGNAAESCSSKTLKRDPRCRARLDELQGRGAKQITDVRDLARRCTSDAVETLKEVMKDKLANSSARVAAANGLLDRGHGKSVQHIEAEISVYDSLSLAGKQALLEVVDEIIDGLDDGDEGNPERLAITHH